MKLSTAICRVLVPLTLFGAGCAPDADLEADGDELGDELAPDASAALDDVQSTEPVLVDKAAKLISLNCRVNKTATAAAHLVNPINNVVSYAPGQGLLNYQSIGTGSVDWTAGPGKGYEATRVVFFLQKGSSGARDLWFEWGGTPTDNVFVPATRRNVKVRRMSARGLPGQLYDRVIMNVYTRSGDCQATSKFIDPVSADAGEIPPAPRP